MPRPAASDTSFGAFPPCAGRMHFMSIGLYLLAAASAASAAARAGQGAASAVGGASEERQKQPLLLKCTVCMPKVV